MIGHVNGLQLIQTFGTKEQIAVYASDARDRHKIFGVWNAEALFDLTRQYLRDLEYTNDPYQKERLGKMAIAIESGNIWLRSAADIIAAYAPVFGGYPTDVNPQAEQLVAYTNMVRTVIEQICIDVMQMCERSVGTRGLLPPNPMERIIRDLTLYLRQPAFDAAISNVGQYVLAESNPARSLWEQ